MRRQPGAPLLQLETGQGELMGIVLQHAVQLQMVIAHGQTGLSLLCRTDKVDRSVQAPGL